MSRASRILREAELFEPDHAPLTDAELLATLVVKLDRRIQALEAITKTRETTP